MEKRQKMPCGNLMMKKKRKKKKKKIGSYMTKSET